MFVLPLIASTLHAVEPEARAPMLDELLEERRIVYDGPLGSLLRDRDAHRVRISLAYVEVDLLRFRDDGALTQWWTSPRADLEVWNVPTADVACDGAGIRSLRALRQARYGGSLSAAFRLSQHLSCSQLLPEATCGALDIAVDCAGTWIAGLRMSPAHTDTEPVVTDPPRFAVDDDTVDATMVLEWELEDLPPVHPIARHRDRFRAAARGIEARFEAIAASTDPVSATSWCTVLGDGVRLALIEPEAFTDPSDPDRNRQFLEGSAVALASAHSGCSAEREAIRLMVDQPSLDDVWARLGDLSSTRLVLDDQTARVDGVRVTGEVRITPGLHLVQRLDGASPAAIVRVLPNKILTLSPDSSELVPVSPERMD